MTASFGIRVIRSSLTDWRPMKKECRHARHKGVFLFLPYHRSQDIESQFVLVLGQALAAFIGESAVIFLQFFEDFIESIFRPG